MQLIIEKIALIKEKFRKIKVRIRIMLTICRNTWNLKLMILFLEVCLLSCNEIWEKRGVFVY